MDFYTTAYGWENGIEFQNPTGLEALLLDFTRSLLDRKRIFDLRRLWRGIIAQQKSAFWYYKRYATELPEVSRENCARTKRILIETVPRYIAWMKQLGEEKEAAYMEEEMALIEREERRKLPKPDPREMTEDVFWEIIEKGNQGGGSTAEQVDAVTTELSRFKGPAIKEFDEILRAKMRDAYSWDVWALAYGAQGGCSDDAFEGFRAWLILQGHKVFEIAVKDVSKAVTHVPAGISTQAQDLLVAAGIAYEMRVGKPLKLARGKQVMPRGKPWADQEFAARYPKLSKYYLGNP